MGDVLELRPAATTVEATLQFLVPGSERPYRYQSTPPAGRAATNAVHVPIALGVHDARRFRPAPSLDVEGFALVPSPTIVGDFDDEAQIRDTYYPEAEALLRKVTGAARVHIFDHTVRRRPAERPPLAGGRNLDGTREPVGRVHVDYTERSGPQRVRDLMGPEAAALLRRRFAIVNVWRPLFGPLHDAPLAVCDARTVGPGQLIASDLIYDDRVGEIYQVLHDPRQRWSYFPRMQASEALLLKCYDSRTDGVARFAPHGAFDDPTAPPGARPRESIELRTLIFFDD